MYIKIIPVLLLVGVLNPIHCETLNPVIIVPGDGGSQMDAVLNKTSVVHFFCRKESRLYNIWINIKELLPAVIDCSIDNLRLVYDNVTRTTSNSPGAEIYIPGFGNTETVEYLDPSLQISVLGYFADIVNSLTKWGYIRGQSVRAAPYDFRKAPNEMGVYFIKLKNLIEDTYIMNNNTPVVLLAHSLGGCVSLYFLNNQAQSWKDKYISKYVTVSAPWGGTIKSLLLFTSGYTFDYVPSEPRHMRRLQRTMPSSAFLMPSDRFWTSDEVLVVTPFKNYTVNDYKEFFNDLDLDFAYQMRIDTGHLIRDLKPPGVDVYCVHGQDIPTPHMLVFDTDSHRWPDDPPRYVYGDGDETVGVRSLTGCLRWVGQQKQEVNHQVFPKLKHLEILSSEYLKDYLKSILFNNN
ncbi:hypothetical protein SNE40_011058 [Patella caerulea]